MKLLISLSYYSPYISGLTQYAKNLAEGISQKNHNVTVLTSHHDKNLPLNETINGVHVIRVPITFAVSKGPIMLGFFGKSIHAVRNADVVNCHLPQFESVIIALLSKSFGKKLIVTYHTDLDNGRSFITRVIKFFLTISHMLTCLCADTIVVQTKDNADHSSFLKYFRKKLVFIYPPIIPPVPASQEVQEAMRKKVGTKKAYYIGFLGRMAKEKGIEYLLHALSKTQKNLDKECIIVIGGPLTVIGEMEYQQKITKLIETKKDAVVVLGRLSDPEKTAFYEMLDVLILPSINSTEAFGMVQIEAMYCGVPVISTDLPGVRVPVQKTNMGTIVPAKNSEKLADALTELLRNREKYVKKRTIIHEEFSFEKSINEYLLIFTR